MLKLYKKIAVPTLFNGCENWTVQKKHGRRIETAEIKFLRLIAAYTLITLL
jgi:hypothetical protein